MNIFRFAGDSSHLIAIVILLVKIWKTRSCAGLSGKSQLLFAFVFSSRYLDLFTNFISPYNTIMKVFFLISSYGTVCVMFFKFKATYDRIGRKGALGQKNNDFGELLKMFERDKHEKNMVIAWSFSIYLEAVAIMPQLFMLSRTGSAETITAHYLFALGTYRAFYLLNWIYRFYTEKFFDPIAVVAGVVQTVLYADFFYLYVTRGNV
uniref:ER lumen protein-retaining receptor n=1 Tax=Setaria digitata TaxID=48799 RepID=A0A915Q6T2_9BILA